LAREVDPLALEEYFALGYVAEPRTVFKGACKLSPGHSLCLRRGEPARAPRATRSSNWWRASRRTSLRSGSSRCSAAWCN
ncbi:MAG: hypothetical protein RR983_16130, partial [Massilia sp.]